MALIELNRGFPNGYSHNAIVIGAPSPKLRPEEIEEHLSELEFLGTTAGWFSG